MIRSSVVASSALNLLKRNNISPQLYHKLIIPSNRNVSQINKVARAITQFHLKKMSFPHQSSALAPLSYPILNGNDYSVQKRNFSSGPSRRNLIGIVASAGAFALAKGKSLLILLKLTKLAPLLSMILTSGTYAIFFGWKFAVGMVGLIFFHGKKIRKPTTEELFFLFVLYSLLETGHMLVMNYFGVPFSAAVYIPFVGAFVGMKAPPKDAWQDAVIAFGGPVLGTVAAGATSLAAVSTDSQLLFALAVRNKK
jgi:hypothetical protein